ncbi:hypothetical protein ASG48_04405 [Aurantimonas sp. Leaf443]|nr:hypothetical protein ASG48_04405 [Aurantimonas sp. Leaf443]
MAALILAPLPSSARAPVVGGASPIAVTASRIEAFSRTSGRTRYGALEFIGGLQFSSGDNRLKGISSMRLRDGGRRFLAVTDSGVWFAGAFRRDEAGRLKGIEDAVMAPMLDAQGEDMGGKASADAEALAIRGDEVFVGFERNHRILSYRGAATPFAAPGRPVPLPIPRRELRANRGIETIAASPKDGPLAGALVAVSERSLDTQGRLYAGLLGGRRNGPFTVERETDWDVTDGAFLPDGDLLLLERRYTGPFGGLGSRIRRIAGETIRPGAVVTGPVIFEADLSDEIDNMEGLDVWTDDAGATRLTLVSDDNGSFLQRNIVLEFRLVDDGKAAGLDAPRAP